MKIIHILFAGMAGMSPRGMLDPAAAKGTNKQGYVNETDLNLQNKGFLQNY